MTLVEASQNVMIVKVLEYLLLYVSFLVFVMSLLLCIRKEQKVFRAVGIGGVIAVGPQRQCRIGQRRFGRSLLFLGR